MNEAPGILEQPTPQPRELLADRRARIRAEVAAARQIASGGDPDPSTTLTAAAIRRVRDALGHAPDSDEHKRLTVYADQLDTPDEPARTTAPLPTATSISPDNDPKFDVVATSTPVATADGSVANGDSSMDLDKTVSQETEQEWINIFTGEDSPIPPYKRARAASRITNFIQALTTREKWTPEQAESLLMNYAAWKSILSDLPVPDSSEVDDFFPVHYQGKKEKMKTTIYTFLRDVDFIDKLNANHRLKESTIADLEFTYRMIDDLFETNSLEDKILTQIKNQSIDSGPVIINDPNLIKELTDQFATIINPSVDHPITMSNPGKVDSSYSQVVVHPGLGLIWVNEEPGFQRKGIIPIGHTIHPRGNSAESYTCTTIVGYEHTQYQPFKVTSYTKQIQLTHNGQTETINLDQFLTAFANGDWVSDKNFGEETTTREELRSEDGEATQLETQRSFETVMSNIVDHTLEAEKYTFQQADKSDFLAQRTANGFEEIERRTWPRTEIRRPYHIIDYRSDTSRDADITHERFHHQLPLFFNLPYPESPTTSIEESYQGALFVLSRANPDGTFTIEGGGNFDQERTTKRRTGNVPTMFTLIVNDRNSANDFLESLQYYPQETLYTVFSGIRPGAYQTLVSYSDPMITSVYMREVDRNNTPITPFVHRVRQGDTWINPDEPTPVREAAPSSSATTYEDLT